MTHRILPAILLAALPVASAAAAAATAPETEYRIVQQREDRLIVELPNRLIIVAQEIPTAPVVSAQAWVRTGSIYEQEFVGAGISHYLEHLASGGTTSTRSEAESNAILGRIGARTNAATGLDNVRYFINTTAEHTAEAVDLLADWMAHSELGADEVARERDVIQEEFRMGEGDPGRLLWRYTQQARYSAHPARHPTIGYIDEFLDITRDDIVAFYHRMYVPNNLVFVVAGDIDKQAVVDQLTAIWKDQPARELPELSFPVEPVIDEPRSITTHADVSRPRVRLAFPGTRLAGEHDYALDLLATVLGRGEASVLVRELRDERGYVNSISAYNLSFDWGEGFFGVDAEIRGFGGESLTDDERIETVREGVLDTLTRLRDEPVTDEQLARAKRQTLASIVQANQTVEGVASRLARDIIAMNDPDYLDRYAEAIDALTAEDLQAAARAHLDPDRLISVMLKPLEAEQAQPGLARPDDEIDAAAFEQEAITLDNRETIAGLRANLAGREHDARPIEVDPLVRYELDNGLRVLVQRSTVVPAVSMQLFFKGGLLSEEPGREGRENAMAAMMMRGSANHTAQELAERLASLGAQMGVSAGNNTTYAQASALTDDWREVLGLLTEVVREPTFPEDEWQRLQPRLLAAIERQADSWYGELSLRFREAYYGDDHPWSQSALGRREVVEGLTAEALRAYHEGRLAAGDAVVAVVGDVEPDAVRDAVAAHFGDLLREPTERFELPATPEPTPRIIQHTTRKPLTAVKVGFGPVIDRADEDYAAIQVASRLISAFPTGWLNQALRGEGPGLAYAQWARLVTGLVPGYFELTFNTNAGSAPEALERSMAVIRRAQDGPIGEADLARAKAALLTSEFFGRQSNGDRAMTAALDEIYGLDDPDGEKFRAAVERVDADTVRAVANRYLREAVVVTISNEPIDEAALEAAMTPREDVDTSATP
ncbi:MAG: pitrilysin family protein [Phycisphaeraceae bacterium]